MRATLTTVRTTLITFVAAGLVVALGSTALGQEESPATAPSAAPVAAASTAPADPTASAICDPFITAAAVSAALGSPVESTDATDFEDRTPPLQHVVCQWSTADGEVVMESSDDTFGMDHEPFLIEKFGAPLGWHRRRRPGHQGLLRDRVPGDVRRLGRATRRHRPDHLDLRWHASRWSRSWRWPERWTARRPRGREAAPEGRPSGGAEALLGTWTLTSAAGDPAPADPVVTLTFGADGTWVLAFDCKPPKGKKAFSCKDTYTADATTVDMAPATSTGSCKDRSLSDFINVFSFTLAMATQPGAWTIEGDVLSITGGPEVTLEFQRAAP